MTTIIHKTAEYALASHRGGGASITRLSDNACVFFQPGDAANRILEDAQDAIDGPAVPGGAPALFDMWCAAYDDVMRPAAAE